MFIEPKDLHLRLVFSPCLCAYLRPLESPQKEEMATWIVNADSVLSILPICWILHIFSCCAELVTFSAREERHRPLAGLMPRPWQQPGRGRRSFSRPPLDDRTTGPPSATSSDRLARVTWPPDHLTSLAPYWPNTWATCYLSWKGSGASQSGSIWSTERDRLVLREVRLLEHLDLNLRLEHFSKQIPPWQSSVRANVLK